MCCLLVVNSRYLSFSLVFDFIIICFGICDFMFALRFVLVLCLLFLLGVWI